MSEIAEFQSYKTTPFFLHHNFKEFYKHFESGHESIKRSAAKFLEDSITFQEERELRIYKALNIDPNNWEELSIKLFGESDKANENNIRSFLTYFTKYIKDELKIDFSQLTNGMKMEAYEASLKNLSGEEEEKELKKIIPVLQKFFSNYTDPVNNYINWLKRNSILQQNESITVEQMSIINQFFKESRDNRAKNDPDFFDKDGNALPIGNQGILRMYKMLRNVSGFLSNIVGNVGEKATVDFMKNVKNDLNEAVIKEVYGTSYFDNKGKNLISGNVSEYRSQEKAISDSLKESGVNVGFRTFNRKKKDKIKKSKTIKSPYVDFEFGYVFTESDTDTLSKNLKSDEIFEIDIEINGEIKTDKVGISSKTSYTDSGELKIYSGSFYSLFENMFKSSEISGAGRIGDIVNFLIYSIFNGYGSGTYGTYTLESYNSTKNEAVTKYLDQISFIEGEAIEYFDMDSTIAGIRFTQNRNEVTTGAHHRIYNYKKGYIPTEKSTEKEKINNIDDRNFTNFFSNEIKPLFDLIVQNFAYQWFTGGTSEYTHADFFSVFSDGVHYFYPMSKILKMIQNAINNGNFILKQDIITNLKDNINNKYNINENPLTLENYRSTWTYNKMEELAANSLKKSGTITVKKGILFKE